MTRASVGAIAIPDGTMRCHRLDDGRYVLLARWGGKLHALDDLCNHAGCQLSRGRLEAGRVVCPCHLMAFDLKTGAAVSIPKLCEDQRTYPVEERDGEIVVTLPDQAP